MFVCLRDRRERQRETERETERQREKQRDREGGGGGGGKKAASNIEIIEHFQAKKAVNVIFFLVICDH